MRSFSLDVDNLGEAFVVVASDGGMVEVRKSEMMNETVIIIRVKLYEKQETNITWQMLMSNLLYLRCTL